MSGEGLVRSHTTYRNMVEQLSGGVVTGGGLLGIPRVSFGTDGGEIGLIEGNTRADGEQTLH